MLFNIKMHGTTVETIKRFILLIDTGCSAVTSRWIINDCHEILATDPQICDMHPEK